MQDKIILIGVPIFFLFLMGVVLFGIRYGEPYPAIFQPLHAKFRTELDNHTYDYVNIVAFDAKKDSFILASDDFFSFFSRGRGMVMYKKIFHPPSAYPPVPNERNLSPQMQLKQWLFIDYQKQLERRRKEQFPDVVNFLKRRADELTNQNIHQLRLVPIAQWSVRPVPSIKANS